MVKKPVLRTLIAIVISFSCLLFVGGVEKLGWLEFLELKMLDFRIQFRDQQKGNKDVVILLIDEASLQSMKPLAGRWPWPRSLFGDLVEFLAQAEAKTVLFDVLFTEPQKPRNQQGELGESDQTFAAATMGNGNVYHAFQLIHDKKDELNKKLLNRSLPKDVISRFSLNVKGINNLFNENNNNYYIPLKELYQGAAGIGVVEFSPDLDGVFRRTKLLREYQKTIYPVLSLGGLIHQKKPKTIQIKQKNLWLGKLKIPLLEDGNFLIYPKTKFDTYSAGGVFASIQKIRQGDFENLIVKPDVFQNKIVLIGGSAVGIEDLKPLSYGPNYPGVFLHASIISNVLDQEFIQKVMRWPQILTLFAGLFIISFLILGNSFILLRSGIPIVLFFGSIIFAFWIFQYSLLLVDTVFPMLTMTLVFGASFIFMSFTEGREQRKTKQILAQYVSPNILSEVLNQGATLKAEVGSKEELTILFSDIRGFTTFSESTSAEQVVEMLNYYLSGMIDIVFEYNGTLDKFIGDAVMAFWGAPLYDENHAKNGVYAGLDMIKKLDEINQYFTSQGYPLFKIGVGLNTGDVILGNIGSEKKLDYTVIGDNVNLASRLEGLTKTYGCNLLITESTFDQVKDTVVSRVVDQVRVKGKHEPIRMYQPVCKVDDQEDEVVFARKIAEINDKAFNAYQKQEWDQSIQYYQEILSHIENDSVSKIFLERCQHYITEPLEETWDGCFNLKTK
ncbi:MAG: adenylate cyclase [bacterium]|jgi:adenylate cyclase